MRRLGEVALEADVAVLAEQEFLELREVRLLGVKRERILARLDELRVVAIVRPVAALDRELALKLCTAHALTDSVVDTR